MHSVSVVVGRFVLGNGQRQHPGLSCMFYISGIAKKLIVLFKIKSTSFIKINIYTSRIDFGKYLAIIDILYTLCLYFYFITRHLGQC